MNDSGDPSEDNDDASTITNESIPAWTDDDDDDSLVSTGSSEHHEGTAAAGDNKGLDIEEEVLSSLGSAAASTIDTSCVLETFSEEVSALILCHLSIEDIAIVSQVSKSLYRACRSNTLWKKLFDFRWNLSDSSCSSTTAAIVENDENNNKRLTCAYFRAYQQAHLHPHDLWITHWNCSFPADGLSPGRCCIRSSSSSSSSRGRPGRHSGSNSTANDDNDDDSSREESKCPACRDLDLSSCTDDDDSSKVPVEAAKRKIHTPVRSMAAQTRTLHHQLKRILDNHSCHAHCRTAKDENRWQQSRRAFACASTFHRRLDTLQYEPGPTHFLTDLLFFNLTDPTFSDGHWELEQLLLDEITLQQQLQEDEQFLQEEAAFFFFENTTHPLPEPRLLQRHEMAHHSWHVLELTNPDWYRPILYQFGVQRPDCFTVYPSQGLIEPGQKAYVTVGIRPLGSALAHAFEALNVQRDGLFDDGNVSSSVLWSDLYTEQAHLPLAPFVVRYRFAMAPPESNVFHGGEGGPLQWSSGRQPPLAAFMGDDENDADFRTKQANMLDYHWRQNVPAHQIRSIHLSAHVHAHYSFLDFFHKTCSPWDFQRDVPSPADTRRGPIMLAPNLRELYPQIYAKVVGMTQEHISKSHSRTTSSDTLTTAYSPSLVLTTEGPCNECGQLWGCREEECMQIFITDEASSLVNVAKRRLLLQNIRKCIQTVERLSRLNDNQVARLCTLLCALFSTIQAVKAAPWATGRQKKILVLWEQIVDDYFCQISQDRGSKADWYPWRLSGVFRYALCTESVFGGPVVCEKGIDEPKYLDAFRHLTHSPGFFCLGQQEDGNHVAGKESNVLLSASSSRYMKKETGFGTTDIFMDDPISALQAGFCMVQDPRSLIVHGLYDSIEYPGTIVRRPRKPLLQSKESRDDCDPTTTIDISYNLSNFTNGTPPPGVGRFALSKSVSPPNDGSPTIVEVNLQDDEDQEAGGDDASLHENRAGRRPHRDPPVENLRGLQFVQLLWSLGAQLGLAVSPDGAPVFVDRKLLIACQWMAISIMLGPLIVTLCARYFLWMPAQPVEYNLDGFPFEFSGKMRYLTNKECGYVAIFLLGFWLALGRWTERHTDRDFFRVMQDHTLPPTRKSIQEKNNRLERIKTRVMHFVQRQWDAMCPLFIQRQVFSPNWNRRSHEDFFKHIAFWRSRNLLEKRPVVRAAAGRAWGTMFGDCRDKGIAVGTVSPTRKLLIGIMVVLGSFCSSTPHFWINLLTVLACSIGLGMSVSLHSMEKGRAASSAASWSTTGSMLTESNLLTVVILSFLIGQLVGSSGGVMFLAEFIVTSVSVVLGGAGTVSASAMESWGCLFCLSSTAFWGYLLARVAIVDGVRHKRMGYTSFLLSNFIGLLCLFWVSVLMLPFDSHVNLIIQQPGDKDIKGWTRKFAEKKLQ